MRIVETTNAATKKQFLQAGKTLYKNDQNWVCPLDNDIERVFDLKANQYFDGGEAMRWVLLDDSNIPIGRVAAFYTKEMIEHEEKIGGMGFFECCEDEAAAKMLMDTAKKWLLEKGFKGNSYQK